MKEFQIIEKYFKPLTKSCKAANYLADDVATFSLKKDEELVISTDLMVENVHFLKKDGGFKIATKLLRSNLSDLAASGAKPLYYQLGLGKSKDINEKFIAEFARGLKETQDKFNITLTGGDTVSSKELFFSITIFGTVKKGQNLARKNAKSGDLIFASGTIGDAYLGLNINLKKPLKNLAKKDVDYLLNRHFCPSPRINLGQELLKQKLSNCAIDISDGLLSDLNHLCQESKLDAIIYKNQIPISTAAKQAIKNNPKINLLDLISGGDDYELIFTADKTSSVKISNLAKKLKLSLTCIGEFKKPATKNNCKIALIDSDKKEIKIKKYGYEHQ